MWYLPPFINQLIGLSSVLCCGDRRGPIIIIIIICWHRDEPPKIIWRLVLIIICIRVYPLWEVFIIGEHEEIQGLGCEFRECM